MNLTTIAQEDRDLAKLLDDRRSLFDYCSRSYQRL